MATNGAMNEQDVIRQMASQLKLAGVRAGGAILVHSSLKSLGQVPGGPESVVRGLLEAVGVEGTVLMPALSYASVGAFRPYFDVRHSPSCVGTIPEHFRRRAGTLRSVCPTHSVSGVGPRAEELLGGQQADVTPCGEHSPFRKLMHSGGQVVMLGCGLRPNTSMHSIEEIVGPPYLFKPEPIHYQVILADGREITMPLKAHDFVNTTQRYDRLEEVLGPGELRRGKVLAAEVWVIEAAAMLDKAVAALRKNPLFFVDRKV
ncbi:MAG: AAC(3) family N-acetyltransferase [Phycisphaeraceae bacterium]|nr:AAC(3) family N-acetyltransferase [Phycisphaeraceae bacterium]